MRAPLSGPTSTTTPAATRAGPPPRRLLLRALPAFCTWGTVAAATSQAPPNAEVRRARQRLDTLQQLHDAASAAQHQASVLQNMLRRVAGPWQAAQDSAAPAQAALEAWRTTALPALADRHARWQQAAAAVDAAVAAHLAAVGRVLTAPAAARADAMARLDTSVAARQAAEAAERAAADTLAQAQRDGRQAVLQLQQRWQALAVQVAQTAEALRASAAAWVALQQQWQALRDQARAAGLDPTTLAALPPAGAPWAVPAAWAAPAAPVDAPLQAWQQADARSRRAWQALWLQRDAQAAVQQALTDATCANTAGTACAAWRADRDALAASLGQQQAALAGARAEQGAAADAARGLAPAARQQLQAMLAWRDGLAQAVGDAGGPALRSLQAAAATGQAALAPLGRARDDARAAWNAAWRQQYGEDAPLELENRNALSASAMPAPGPQASFSRVIEISSHALHRLHARDDEPTGFGAYTYVLVGASVRPDTPGVFARLQRLLAEVRNLPVAATVAADLRARANTFVVPVPPGNRDDQDLVVDLALAQSLLTHLPPVLRLADASRRQLYAENGPFLVTLPGRMADARADWPLLFADLSKTPEVVVADVVRRYMADLIGSFNPASTDWSPPAGMQVSIALVRMVKGTGDVVQAIFPSFLRR